MKTWSEFTNGPVTKMTGNPCYATPAVPLVTLTAKYTAF
jgi:hypothetical protein